MSEEEAKSVTDIWRLNLTERYRLYRYWLALYQEDQKAIIQSLGAKYNEVTNRLKVIREDEE